MSKVSYVMKMRSGYAYASLKTLENVIVTDNDCQNAKYIGTVLDDESNTLYCRFRVNGKNRFQLAAYCEPTKVRAFFECNVEREHIYCDRSELIYNPLWYHSQGLQQTASGYGSKLVNPSCIWFEGKVYRLYTTCWSNAGTTWFKVGERKIIVS